MRKQAKEALGKEGSVWIFCRMALLLTVRRIVTNIICDITVIYIKIISSNVTFLNEVVSYGT